MKYIISILFTLIFVQQLSSQVTPHVHITKDIVDEKREKIIIQTNQQVYKGGDTIWIRCHLFDGATQILNIQKSNLNISM